MRKELTTPIEASLSKVIQQSKPYELDWNKVKTVEDVIWLLKLINGIGEQTVTMYLYDHQVNDYRHLFKEDGHGV